MYTACSEAGMLLRSKANFMKKNPISAVPATRRERLRTATSRTHDALDKHAFFGALASGTLPLGAYATYLRAWTAVAAAVEACMKDCTHTAVRALAGQWTHVLPALHRDLLHLAEPCPADPPAAVERAGQWAAGIRLRAAETPAALVGILYVTAGAGLGAAVLAPRARDCFGFGDGPGADALSALARDTELSWPAFTKCLDGLELTPAEDDAATAAATDYFEGLRRVADALVPYDPASLRTFAFTLNPHAGNQPVTEDPREIAAARVAAHRCWEAFPYLKARYGLKGRLYADSDGAWLATLAGLGKEAALRQILWLGRVLAARGMPSAILEDKLRRMAEAFGAEFPDRPEPAARFTELADHLCAAREATLDAANAAALVQGFGEELTAKETAGIPALLVAAAVDEANGATGAVAAIRDWMAATEFFPPEWTKAADRLVVDTRARLHGKTP